MISKRVDNVCVSWYERHNSYQAVAIRRWWKVSWTRSMPKRCCTSWASAKFGIKKIEDSYVFLGDGSSHTRVTFRFVIWRPFIDEVLVGKHFVETFAKGRCNYPPKSLGLSMGLCKCPKEIYRFFSNFWIF